MSFIYEIAAIGQQPSFDKDARVAFKNPVAVGDKIYSTHHSQINSPDRLVKVVEVEHYNDVSVLYYDKNA